MDPRTRIAQTLIVSGTLLNLAAIALLFFVTQLSAADARDHREQAAALLRSTHVDRVQLTDWSEPPLYLAWVISLGGFVMAFLGIRGGMARPSATEQAKPRVDHEWADRGTT